MRQLVDRSGERYAVIEAHWTKGPPERFVIAYRDEECLRDLIAAPSIIATGFASREGAASIAACLSARAVSKKTQKALAVDGSETDQRGTQSPTQRWRDGFGACGNSKNSPRGSTACCRSHHADVLFQECPFRRNSIIFGCFVLATGRCHGLR